jgi:predicted choloylglycine hydrolase
MQFPDLLIEIHGISAGAQIPIEQVSLLNTVLGTNDLESDGASRTFELACSAIGFAESEFGPLVAKNCDENPKAAPFYLFQEVLPERGMKYACIGWVGTVWAEAGLNEAGLALVQTAGPSALHQDGYGIACTIAPRPVIERCRSTDQAIDMLSQMKVAGWGMCAVLADRTGSVTAVEKTSTALAVVPPHDGVVYCTNHFVAPTMQGMLPILHDGLKLNSEQRYLTLSKIFSEGNCPHSFQGIRSALAYHGKDGFVCQHGGAGLQTNYSFIASARNHKIWLGDGHPCQGEYTEFSL